MHVGGRQVLPNCQENLEQQHELQRTDIVLSYCECPFVRMTNSLILKFGTVSAGTCDSEPRKKREIWLQFAAN